MRLVPRFLVGLALFPVAVGAQLAPDTPRMVSPHASGGLGVHWVRAHTLPFDDEAVLVTWAMPGLPDGMRLRGGAGRGAHGGNAFLGGFDLQRPAWRGDSLGSFIVDWQGGVGASVGDFAVVTVPVGITAGVMIGDGALTLSPYLTAGAVTELRMGDVAPPKRFDVGPAVDAGADIGFDRERRFVLRVAASLGDRQAMAVGFAMGVGSANATAHHAASAKPAPTHRPLPSRFAANSLRSASATNVFTSVIPASAGVPATPALNPRIIVPLVPRSSGVSASSSRSDSMRARAASRDVPGIRIANSSPP